MKGPNHNHSSFRAMRGTLLIGLLVASFLVRSLIPAGYMPNFGGGAAVVLCTVNGPVTVHAPDAAIGQHAQAHQECPFAFALGMAAAGTFASGVEFIATTGFEALAPVHSWRPDTAPANYGARAPPFVV